MLLVLPDVLCVSAVWHVVRWLLSEPKANTLNDEIVLSRRLLRHEWPESIASIVNLTTVTKQNEANQYPNESTIANLHCSICNLQLVGRHDRSNRWCR